MMLNVKIFSCICFVLLVSINLHAQTKRDSITPEKLIITKQYKPSVNDAFKIKKQPKAQSDILSLPNTLSYSIVKVPVASTFSPAKGNIGRLRLTPDNLDAFGNYAKVGAGNFTSFMADFYSEIQLQNNQKFNVGLSHFSSQGGIDEVNFDDDFSNNALQLKFVSEERSFLWNISGGLSYNTYNYYGIPEDVVAFFDASIGDISQQYLGFNLGGELRFYDAAFKQLSIDFSNFSDAFDSVENRFKVKPQVDFFIKDQRIENFFELDYVSGEIQNQTISDYAYSWLVTSYNPNIQINEDRFSIQLGAEFAYLSDLEGNEGEFYIYPKLEGSYRINQDNLIAFGGVDGGLDQNTYQGFAQINPFVAPISIIAPTNRQYDAFLGIKGGNYGLSYSTKVSFTSQENNPFFTSSTAFTDGSANQAFNYANAFAIVYDDLTTTAVDVEIDYSFNTKFNIGLHANYSNYNTSNLEEAWNLPTTSATLFTKYNLNNKWAFLGSVFYVGERKDNSLSVMIPEPGIGVETISSFVDANFSVQYKINSQLHAFVEANNMFGGNYQRWLNYPVQDLQILGGVTFQFDW